MPPTLPAVTPPRIGFLGAGLIASAHAAGLEHGAGGRFVPGPVHDPDRGRVVSFHDRFGYTPAVSEDEVLDGCEAVYVCTWTSEHRRLVEAAAARGRAVFCEKPLATSLADAEAMVAAVEAAGVVHQCGLVLRSSPGFTVLRAMAHDREATGDVMAVVFRDDQYLPTQGFYGSTWRGDVRLAGAGALLEHSVHDVDLLEWIAGPAVSVTARASYRHAIEGVEDVAAATAVHASGAISSLVSVWHDDLARPNERLVEVIGARRTIRLDGGWGGPIRWRDADGTDHELAGDALEAAAHAAGWRPEPDAAFVDAVTGGTPAWPGLDLALRAQRVVDAMYRSAAAGGAPVALGA